MKKILLATILAACTTSAMAAAPTALLNVDGKLIMSACTPTLVGASGGGIVDYGPYTLDDLSSTAVNQLGKKNIDLTINCPVATKVAWEPADDKASSRAKIPVENGNYVGDTMSASGNLYGVGATRGGVNIGNYSLYIDLSKVTANGSRADTLIRGSSSNGSAWSSWARSTDGATSSLPQEDREFSVSKSGTYTPIGITTATFPLVTVLAIQDTTTLNITDDTDLDGQATITLRYL